MATLSVSAGPAPAAVVPTTRQLQWLPTLLGVIAGTVEVIAYLMLGGLFTAHVTGNLVIVAALVARGGSPTAPQVLALPVFMAAMGAMWLIAKAMDKRGDSLVRPLLAVQFFLLALVLAVCIVFDVSSQTTGLFATVAAATATAAIACQFALLRLAMPGSPSSAVMTGNLTNAELYLLEMAWRGRPLMPSSDRAKQPLGVLVGFCCGCIAGAVAVLVLGDWSWSLPVVLAGVAFGLVPGSSNAGATKALRG